MGNGVDLPTELRISTPGRALVYPTAAASRGDVVVGRGDWTFLFDRADEHGVASVRLGDLAFHLRPGSCVHFDVNGDGLLERLDLSELRLTRENVDLEQSGGTVNVDTGDVTLRVVFSIDPHEIPGLEALTDSGRISFDVTERGRFDLARGRFHTAAVRFTVPDGPFAGLTFLNCGGGDGTTDQCYATVALGVCVLPEGKPAPALDIPAGQAPKAVWICPGTPIRLVWASTHANEVDITPDVGHVAATGAQLIPDPGSPNAQLHAAITQSRTMHAQTVDEDPGCTSAGDDITINVMGPKGAWGHPQKATYVDGTNYWSAHLPDHTYDSRILVSQVIIDGPSTHPDGITHPSWRVDHIYDAQTPVGTPIPALNTPEPTASWHPLPGEYRFSAEPPNVELPAGETRRSIYFRLFTEPCR